MTEQNNTAFDLSAARVFRGMKIAETFDDARYYLSGVFIEPIKDGGAWIVATDGTIMLVQHDRTAIAKESATLRFLAPQPQPVEDDDGLIARDWHWCNSRISVPDLAPSQTVAAPVAHKDSAPWLHVLAEKIDGTFPDWRKPLGKNIHIPDSRYKDRLGGIDTLLLQRLCGPYHGHQGIQIHGSFSDEMPFLVTFGADPDSFGVFNKRKLSLSSSPLNDLLTAIGRDDLAEGTGAAEGGK